MERSGNAGAGLKLGSEHEKHKRKASHERRAVNCEQNSGKARDLAGSGSKTRSTFVIIRVGASSTRLRPAAFAR